MPDEVLSKIRHINRYYVRHVRQFLAPYQYVGTMHMVLLYVNRHPGASQEEVACFYGLDKTGIARDCKNLEALGHLTRTTAPEDRRQNRLYLTETGTAFLPTIYKMSDQFSQKISESFTAAEWNELSRLLSRAETNLSPRKPEKEDTSMKLTWFGHACFMLEHKGFRVIFDPFKDGSVPGIPDVRAEADLVLCSHDHGDHNAEENIKLRTGNTNPFTVTEIHTFHDDAQGSKRGPVTARILEADGIRVAHMGDIGCEPDPAQLPLLENLDVMLVPVGGFFTIDAQQARALVEQVQPKVVVPMHYRGEDFGYEVIGPLSAYTDLCSDVTEYPDNTLEITKSMSAQTAVLKYK